jgi:hypothetical protein
MYSNIGYKARFWRFSRTWVEKNIKFFSCVISYISAYCKSRKRFPKKLLEQRGIRAIVRNPF